VSKRNIWDAMSGEWIEVHAPWPSPDKAWHRAMGLLLAAIWIVTVAVVWHVIAEGLPL